MESLKEAVAMAEGSDPKEVRSDQGGRPHWTSWLFIPAFLLLMALALVAVVAVVIVAGVAVAAGAGLAAAWLDLPALHVVVASAGVLVTLALAVSGGLLARRVEGLRDTLQQRGEESWLDEMAEHIALEASRSPRGKTRKRKASKPQQTSFTEVE